MAKGMGLSGTFLGLFVALWTHSIVSVEAAAAPSRTQKVRLTSPSYHWFPFQIEVRPRGKGLTSEYYLVRLENGDDLEKNQYNLFPYKPSTLVLSAKERAAVIYNDHQLVIVNGENQQLTRVLLDEHRHLATRTFVDQIRLDLKSGALDMVQVTDAGEVFLRFKTKGSKRNASTISRHYLMIDTDGRLWRGGDDLVGAASLRPDSIRVVSQRRAEAEFAPYVGDQKPVHMPFELMRTPTVGWNFGGLKREEPLSPRWVEVDQKPSVGTSSAPGTVMRARMSPSRRVKTSTKDTPPARKDARQSKGDKSPSEAETLSESSDEGEDFYSMLTGEVQEGDEYIPLGQYLKGFTTDLTEKARKKNWACDVLSKPIIDQILVGLMHPSTRSVVALGEAGVGKSYIMRCFAAQIASGQVPESLKKMRLLSFSGGSLNAGAGTTGMSEARVQALIRAAEQRAEDGEGIIYVVDEIDNLRGKGAHRDDPNDVTSLMLAEMGDAGPLQIVGMTSQDKWERAFGGDQMWTRRFSKVRVPNPNFDEAVWKLKNWLVTNPINVSRQASLMIPQELIEETIRLSSRFDRFQAQPDAGIQLLGRVMSRLIFEGKWDVKALQKMDLISYLQETAAPHYNVSLEVIRPKPAGEVLEKVELKVRENLVGVESAWQNIKPHLRIALSGLSDPERPLGRLLLLGPPGTGKTSIVHAIGEELRLPVERIMLSHFSDPYEGGSALKGHIVSAVRKNPMTILLFDEIEKGHSDVLQVLDDILDSGTLKYEGKIQGDSASKIPVKLDLRQNLIFAAGNAGHSKLGRSGPIGFGGFQAKAGEGLTRSRQFTEEMRNLIEASVPEYIVDRFEDIILLGDPNRAQFKQAILLRAQTSVKSISEKRRVHIEVRNLEAFAEFLTQREYQEGVNFRDKNRMVDLPLLDALARVELNPGSMVRLVWDESAQTVHAEIVSGSGDVCARILQGRNANGSSAN